MNRTPTARSLLKAAWKTAWPVLGLAGALTSSPGCGRGPETAGAGEVTESRSDLTGSCTSSTITLLDMQADFRDIWKGTETPATGKQTDPLPTVGLDFSTTVSPSQVAAQFVPVQTGGACGPTVAASSNSSVVASAVWGTTTSDSARAPVPSAFNVLVRDTISGIVSAGGAVAAGGDVTLSSMSINGTVHQPVGLIAGGKIAAGNGSISGNVTYGVQSTFPQTVTVSGTKSLQSFSATSAFQDLAALSALLADETPNGTTTSANGGLTMTGTNAALNVFQVSADSLSQSSFVQLTVPANAAAIVNVTGNMTVGLQNKGLSVQGATAATLLWNIPAAAFVQISGLSIQGSILAPRSLVSFDSGSINGTLVAQAFTSTGSGSLQATALTVSKLFPATTPSLVRLTPAQPLVRGCQYHFVIPATAPLTTAGGCLASPIDVQFHVAGSVVPAAGRELTNVEPDPALHTLRRFTARPGINTPVDQVWDRYQAAIGIPSSNLVPTTNVQPSSTLPGQTVTVYQQYAQGYPVAGYGYFVAAQGGMFRAANGKVMPGMPVFASPAVSSSAALQDALTYLKITTAPWVSNPSANHAPTGQLVVVSKHSVAPAASDFVLAWDFRFGQGTGILSSAGIRIDATTGAVLAVDGAMESLTPLNAQATYTSPANATVDTIYNGMGKAFSVASYTNPDQSVVGTLTTGKITDPGTLSTVTGVTEDANGNLVGTPEFIAGPTPPALWSASDKVAQRMATLQWGLEQANGFLQGLNLTVGGAVWQGVDGATPHQQIHINYTDGTPASPDSAAYSTTSSTPDLAQIFIDLSGGFFPLQAGTVGHEYTHALIDGLRRATGLGGAKGIGTLALYNEAASLNEGLADLFAVAMNHQRVTQNQPWFCIELDRGQGPECWRDTSSPLFSVMPTLNNGPPGLPDLYKDVGRGYVDFSSTPASGCTLASNNDRCGAHQNSTIVSHWGYLAAMGTGGVPVPCGLSFGPLGTDPDAALRTVLNIAFVAISSRTALTTGGLTVNATFADFRDATLQVADELLQAGTITSDVVAQIELAWAAVGLPPLASHSTVAAPANVDGAYPWATFTWPLVGDGQSAGSWDFQLTTGTFDMPTFHKEGVTGVSSDVTSAVMPLALPSNTPDTYYWRVRPASTLPWEACYPIHSFVGTTVPDPVSDLRIATSSLASTKGDVLPGVFDATWDTVRGTITPDYDAYIGTQNPQCTEGNGVTKIPSGGVSIDVATTTYDVPFVSQPKTHYFLNVRPIGPPDLSGATTHGDCNTLEFDTADLLPPTIATPDATGLIYTDHWTDVFNWTTSGGAVKSEVRLYTRNADGTCGSTPVLGPFEVQFGCARSCDESFTLPTTTALPNPGGYCWTVTDVAANGDEGPASDPKKIGFSAFTLGETPGVDWSEVYTGESEGSIPGDSYGKDVTFSWTTLPNFASAPKYGFKIGRWFWPEQLSSPDPVNCVDGNTSLGLCTRGPTADTLFETTITDAVLANGVSTKTFPGQFNQGRYCWGIWPVFGDDPTQDPSVDFSLSCYTTGPATPTILPDTSGPGYSVDATPPTGTFPQQPITGEIDLAYIPDGQMKITPSPGVTITGSCQPDPDAQGHQDYYNCSIPYVVTPYSSGKYTIEVQTFNSDPPDTTSDPVQDVVRTITVGACGVVGQSCCSGASCAEGVCEANKCVASAVTILSPANFTHITPGDGLTLRWTDPHPPVAYDIIFRPNTPDQSAFLWKASGTASTVQEYTDPADDLLLVNQQPLPVEICPYYADGTFGQCDQRSINSDPPKDCSQPLAAPVLPQPDLSQVQGELGCTNIDDLQARAACIENGGPDSDQCAYFIPSSALALGWDAVPGATGYQLTELSAAGLTTIPVAGTSGHVQTAIPFNSPLPIVCPFGAYGVSVVAVDDVCHRTSQTAVTGIGYEP